MKHTARFLMLLAALQIARAHFVFVVPDATGRKVEVMLTEDMKPTPAVPIAMLAPTRLQVRTAGTDAPLPLTKGEHAYTGDLPGSGTRVVHGVTDLGIMQRGNAKPHVLDYYPKTILGDPFDKSTVLGDSVPVELIPVRKDNGVALELRGNGKTLPDAEIIVILPGGTQKKVKTGDDGVTEAFPETGRIGAWARFWVPSTGERNGKPYEELRHYATLVFDHGRQTPTARALPEATASFGAAIAGGWLYVYGGHIAPTHSYSTAAVSGRFHRVNLNAPGQWESLPSGPGLQGLNLAAHDGNVYRIGGMLPRNAPDQPADNHSTADAARFHPSKGQWENLPPLPEARSSHDFVVIGDKLIVVGGWNMKGKTQEWFNTVAELDLSKPGATWQTYPQPFKRRALIAAAHQNRVYVIGGITDQNKVVPNVSVYDPATHQWSEGPALPSSVMPFAPAAATQKGSLFVGVADGTILKLTPSNQWEKVAQSAPRVAHRMVAHDGSLLILGGATKGKNLDLIETIVVSQEAASR